MGFYYGWVIVGVIVMCGLATSIGTLPVLSVLLKPITEDFGWSRTAFTGAITLGTVSGALIAPVIGPFFDRYGARWILTISFILLGFTITFLGSISTLWHLYALMILGRAINLGIISIATTGAVVPKWFIAKRGRAVAISGMGQRVGLSVHPLILQALVGLGSWRTAAIAMGILVWAIAILPVALFLRRKPEDLGLLPDGENPETSTTRLPWIPTQKGIPKTEISFRLSETLRQPSFYLLTGAFSLSALALAGSSFHAVAYLTDRMLSPQTAVIVIAIWAGAAIFGMLIAGFLLEHLGARRTVIAVMGSTALSYGLMLAIHSTSVAVIWGIYFGLTTGGMTVLQQVILADYFGREFLGAIRGTFAIGQSSANATGTLLAAITYDTLGSYNLIFMAFALISAVSAVLVIFSRPPAIQRKVTST